VGHVQYICPIPGGFQEVAVRCYARLNTLRDNRLLEPSFWAKVPTGQVRGREGREGRVGRRNVNRSEGVMKGRGMSAGYDR